MHKRTEAVVLLAEGFEEIEAITIIDTLRRAQVETQVAAIGSSLEVHGGHGITVKADCLLTGLRGSKLRLVVLPGGSTGVKNIAASAEAKHLTATATEVAAICAAPKALVSARLVEGRAITAYPGVLDDQEGIRLSSAAVVRDGTFITSRGPGTALDFALTLIETLCGRASRDNVEAALQR